MTTPVSQTAYAQNHGSKIARKEDNDCTVRSIMVTFGLTYDAAHMIAKQHLGRKDRDGVYGFVPKMNQLAKLRATFNGQRLVTLPEEMITRKVTKKATAGRSTTISFKYEKTRQYTLRRFVREYPVGKFIIGVRGHALAIIDGVIQDWNGIFDNPSDLRRIDGAWQVLDKQIANEIV